MPPAGFERAIPASERLQTHALDRAVSRSTDKHYCLVIRFCRHTELCKETDGPFGTAVSVTSLKVDVPWCYLIKQICCPCCNITTQTNITTYRCLSLVVLSDTILFWCWTPCRVTLNCYPITGLDRPLRLQQVEAKQWAHESDKVFSPTPTPSLPFRRYSWYSFLLEAKSTPAWQFRRKDYINEKCQWSIRNWTRNLAACREDSCWICFMMISGTFCRMVKT